MKIRDKIGREIEPGDVLKVFHFVGARGKKNFLFQQALRYERGRLVISHLNRIDDQEPWEIGKNYYSVGCNERVLREYEIVDSIDAKFDDRPKAPPARPKQEDA